MKLIDELKHWRPGGWFWILTAALMVGVYFSLQILPNRWERLYAAQTEFNPALPCVSADGFAPEMVALAGGVFEMGSPENEPQRRTDERLHDVTIEPFAISRCEVTFADYRRYVDDSASDEVTMPSDAGWGQGSRPVINVSWLQATAYAAWLTEKTGEQYRLPTEAQWEYAARAMDAEATRTIFGTGNCITPEQANFNNEIAYADCPAGGDTVGRTRAVGSYQPNQWGLYDMHGNVWEWTCSVYDSNYGGSETRCEEGASAVRVLRGGSWGLEPRWLRSAYRIVFDPSLRNNDVGFRVARAIR